MTMTESEANGRRCLVLELIQALYSSAAPGGPTAPIGCIGSHCAMAWRWAPDSEEIKNRQYLKSGQKPEGFVDYDTADADGFKWSSSDDGVQSDWYLYKCTKHGYCGLAGAPQ